MVKWRYCWRSEGTGEDGREILVQLCGFETEEN